MADLNVLLLEWEAQRDHLSVIAKSLRNKRDDAQRDLNKIAQEIEALEMMINGSRILMGDMVAQVPL
jgi:uncharacterized coiled-coil DUF342 family protein